MLLGNFTKQTKVNVIINSLVITATLPSIFSFPRGIWGPQSQVIPQQLHYQGTVLVTVLIKSVQLGDGIVKGLEQNKSVTNNILQKQISLILLGLEKNQINLLYRNLKKKQIKICLG